MADKGLKYVGANPIKGMALGSQVGKKLYLGDALVWEKVLPYDAEVEYLKSDGTAYIDLGKTLNSSTDVVDIDFTSANTTVAKGVFGARTAAADKNFSTMLSAASKVVVDVNNGSYATYRITSNQTINLKRCIAHIERKNKYVSFDGVVDVSSTASSHSFETSGNAFVFAINGFAGTSGIELYALRWHRNGTLLFDLIPVRKNGVGYLYDKISGELFGNAAGSGNFVYGSDVATT